MKLRAGRLLQALAATVGVLAIVSAGVVVFIVATWDRPVRRSSRDLHAPADAQALARGEYLYNRSMLCWTCHGSAGGHDPSETQAGGRMFDMSGIGPGFGVVWGSNLTSDPETGIGRATDGQLVRAIREGIDRRGKVIFPVMAYQFYHGLGDEDALALVTYLRSLAPVRHEVRARELSFIAKALIAFGQIQPETEITSRIDVPPHGPSVEYGEYVTWHASGCAECHTPRFPQNGQLDRTRLMGGGLFPFPEAGFSGAASNLTRDDATGLGGWSEAEFGHAVRSGVRRNGSVMVPFMPWPSYSSWSDEDLHAVWVYLRSLPPVSHVVTSPTLTGDAAGGPGLRRGQALFDIYCVSCHGERGRGGAIAPTPLRQSLHDFDGAALRAFIIDGVPGTPMPPFAKTFTTEQLADILGFMNSWTTNGE